MICLMTRPRDKFKKLPANHPKAAVSRIKQRSRICSASIRGGSSTRYVPTSLDEILTLEQCATWLQQPELMLREMIQAGTLKPLPFPGENFRLHARTVLLQLGMTGEALGQPPKPGYSNLNTTKGGTQVSRLNHPFTKGITPVESAFLSSRETVAATESPARPPVRRWEISFWQTPPAPLRARWHG